MSSIIKENLLASVSTCNNVIKGPKEMYPCFLGIIFKYQVAEQMLIIN
jgi:hypothetical protein